MKQLRRAEEAAIEAVKPGVTAMELDKTARDIITEAGYGEYFTHRLGHGLGISVHEFPSITGVNDMKLEEGMVFTIEPGIYNPEITGVRIEDDVVVTEDGVEVLTKFPERITNFIINFVRHCGYPDRCFINFNEKEREHTNPRSVPKKL